MAKVKEQLKEINSELLNKNNLNKNNEIQEKSAKNNENYLKIAKNIENDANNVQAAAQADSKIIEFNLCEMQEKNSATANKTNNENDIKNHLEKEVIEDGKQFASTVFGETKLEKDLSFERLFGELLRFLRQQQEQKLVQVCRGIENIITSGNTAEIVASKEVVLELQTGRAHSILNKFFNKFGLNLKLYNQADNAEAVSILNNLLGGNLKITKN